MVSVEIRTTYHIYKTDTQVLFPPDVCIKTTQLHGFSDASENAYAAIVYFRLMDTSGNINISLVNSKMKVASIKRLTIPRLELCGAYLLSDVLSHMKEVFNIPMCNTFTWCDSTIVIDWLNSNPRRFKTFVGNRISHIIDHIPPDR